MTIKVKKGDVEMLTAFRNQCEGEIIATKRRRNERAGRHECQQQPPSADVAPQEPVAAAPAASVSTNGKVIWYFIFTSMTFSQVLI